MIRFLCILMLVAAPVVRAQSAADKFTTAGIAEFTAAYQAWDGDRFAAATKLFRQASATPPATVTNYYWLGASEFHRMLHLRGNPTNTSAAAAALDSAVEALTIGVKLDEKSAETQALLGTLYGMKINGSLLRAAWFGPRVAKYQGGAMKFGATNPRVQYLLGMCQFHLAKKPAAWQEVLTTLLGAEKLFAAEARTAAAPLEPRWGYDSCLTFIGRTYELLGQRKEAEEYFSKALAMHPADHLAKEGLKRVSENK
jgi:tetratricopeptide (TPR) repeat protein